MTFGSLGEHGLSLVAERRNFSLAAIMSFHDFWWLECKPCSSLLNIKVIGLNRGFIYTMNPIKAALPQEPLVSVVIPCYNHAEFVKESILSVIDQDYKNIELIIIDDDSVDKSVEQIQELIPTCQNRFMRFEFRTRPNKGLAATLNEAIEWCEGEFFATLASDDVIEPSKTAIQVNYLNANKEAIGVFGGTRLIGDARGTRNSRILKRYTFKDILLHNHVLLAPTQLLRLRNVREVGGYRDNLIIEDWSMWLLLTEGGGTLDSLNEVLAQYRIHGDNTSAKHLLMKRGREDVLSLYSSHPLYKAALCKALLLYANETTYISKINSIKVAIKAIKDYPFGVCLFKNSLAKLLLKTVLWRSRWI